MVPKLFHPCGNALRRRVSLLRQASATTECEDIQQNSTGIDDQKVDEKSCCDQILNCQSVICFLSTENKKTSLDVGPKQWPLRTKELRSQPPWIQCEGCLPLHQIAAGSWGSSFPREGRYWRLRAKVWWCDYFDLAIWMKKLICSWTGWEAPTNETIGIIGYWWLLRIFPIKCSCRVSSRVPLCHAYALVKTCRMLSTLW